MEGLEKGVCVCMRACITDEYVQALKLFRQVVSQPHFAGLVRDVNLVEQGLLLKAGKVRKVS